VSLASTSEFAEVFQKCQQSIKNHDILKMYQYHSEPSISILMQFRCIAASNTADKGRSPLGELVGN